MNIKVWVCMSCHIVHFSPNQDYAECIDGHHEMYVGFVWPVKEEASSDH